MIKSQKYKVLFKITCVASTRIAHKFPSRFRPSRAVFPWRGGVCLFLSSSCARDTRIPHCAGIFNHTEIASHARHEKEKKLNGKKGIQQQEGGLCIVIRLGSWGISACGGARVRDVAHDACGLVCSSMVWGGIRYFEGKGTTPHLANQGTKWMAGGGERSRGGQGAGRILLSSLDLPSSQSWRKYPCRSRYLARYHRSQHSGRWWLPTTLCLASWHALRRDICGGHGEERRAAVAEDNFCGDGGGGVYVVGWVEGYGIFFEREKERKKE